MQVCSLVTVLLTCPKCSLRVACRWRDELAQEASNLQALQNRIQSPLPPPQPPLHASSYPGLGHPQLPRPHDRWAVPVARQQIYPGGATHEYPHLRDPDGHRSGSNTQQSGMDVWRAGPVEPAYSPPAGTEGHLVAGLTRSLYWQPSEMNGRVSHPARQAYSHPYGIDAGARPAIGYPRLLGVNEALLGPARQEHPRLAGVADGHVDLARPGPSGVPRQDYTQWSAVDDRGQGHRGPPISETIPLAVSTCGSVPRAQLHDQEQADLLLAKAIQTEEDSIVKWMHGVCMQRVWFL